jgi:phage-related tail fiber protein
MFNSAMDDIASDLNTPRPVSAGGTGAGNASTARANLGLEIGDDVQAYSAALDALSDLDDVTEEGQFIVSNDSLEMVMKTLSEVKELLGVANGAVIPIGGEIFWTGSTVPAGFLEEDGGEYSRTEYAELWAHAQSSGMYDATGADAAMFGPGDGATTFTVPDVRADFIRAWDHGRGVDSGRALGSWQDESVNALSRVQTGNVTSGSSGDETLPEDGSWTDWMYTSQNGANSDQGRIRFKKSGNPTYPRNAARMLIIRAL